jgi:hypothetical protein
MLNALDDLEIAAPVRSHRAVCAADKIRVKRIKAFKRLEQRLERLVRLRRVYFKRQRRMMLELFRNFH